MGSPGKSAQDGIQMFLFIPCQTLHLAPSLPSEASTLQPASKPKREVFQLFFRIFPAQKL